VQKESSTLNWQLGDVSELDSQDSHLLEQARQALRNAYAPYSNFPVGAALRLSTGEIITGNNQENASYPNGLCAERVAMFAAASIHPEVAFNALAIVTTTPGAVCPCGICRQTMLEYTHRFQTPFKLLLSGTNNKVLVFDDASALLPLGFTSKHLKDRRVSNTEQ
jgi:cytidine deaminase